MKKINSLAMIHKIDKSGNTFFVEKCTREDIKEIKQIADVVNDKLKKNKKFLNDANKKWIDFKEIDAAFKSEDLFPVIQPS